MCVACVLLLKLSRFVIPQVDNREVTKFLSAVWRSLSQAEKRRNWSGMNQHDKDHFTNIAQDMIRTTHGVAGL